MRKLVPDSRGIIIPSKSVINHAGSVHVYTRPNPSLIHIDRLQKGERPNICITRKQGGIGDVLMTLPTVKAIANKYNIKVDYGTDLHYLNGALPKVLIGNPYIREVISWDKVDHSQYHAVLDLTCPCIGYEKPKCDPVHRIDLFAKHLHLPLNDHDIDYYIQEEEKIWAADYLIRHNLDKYRLLLIQPSSSALPRDAPSEIIQRALTIILKQYKDIRPIVITHSSDNKKIHWKYGDIHIAHDLDVRAIAALIPRTNLVICPDSAILHLAAALHHPTLTLFGPTDPRARINYHPEAVAIWPGKELNNYPIWFANSPDNYLCWKRLDENLIAETAICMLNNQQLPKSRDLVTFGNYKLENEFYQKV